MFSLLDQETILQFHEDRVTQWEIDPCLVENFNCNAH